MKGNTGVTDIVNVDFIFMPSAELIQEMSQVSLKVKKIPTFPLPHELIRSNLFHHNLVANVDEPQLGPILFSSHLEE